MHNQTKLPRRIRRFVKKERGTQLVELAIVLPVMLMLFASIAEFSNFFSTYTALDKRRAWRRATRLQVGKECFLDGA